ncbi:hypothetical protein FS749_002820 [Ceratobasidium sp. UAMH 11750]|nr:hypothetical protein FS749_002820 [Ceratobasidium sp. UAMH 11750]
MLSTRVHPQLVGAPHVPNVYIPVTVAFLPGLPHVTVASTKPPASSIHHRARSKPPYLTLATSVRRERVIKARAEYYTLLANASAPTSAAPTAALTPQGYTPAVLADTLGDGKDDAAGTEVDTPDDSIRTDHESDVVPRSCSSHSPPRWAPHS